MTTIFDYDGLIKKVGQCCLTEEECGTCAKENCLIGYCKESILTCLKKQDGFLADGMANLPVADTKVYDPNAITQALGFLLHQCRNCYLYHDDDCLLNIIRSSLEIIIFGESLDFMGSALAYLNEIKDKNPEMAAKIAEVYQSLQESSGNNN